MLLSGVHATIAGVLTAIAVPMRASGGRSPLVTAEHALKPWVVLAIMPLFALTNAGVPLAGVDADVLIHPITMGVGLGLFLGKPIGIMLFTLIAAALLKRPQPGSPSAMLGVAMLAGIGFTMSLFIGATGVRRPGIRGAGKDWRARGLARLRTCGARGARRRLAQDGTDDLELTDGKKLNATHPVIIRPQ